MTVPCNAINLFYTSGKVIKLPPTPTFGPIFYGFDSSPYSEKGAISGAGCEDVIQRVNFSAATGTFFFSNLILSVTYAKVRLLEAHYTNNYPPKYTSK